MRLRALFSAVLLAFILFEASCSGSSSATLSSHTPTPANEGKPTIVSDSSKWLSAKEAVQQAYTALNTDWKAKATLVFVARYSQYAGEKCSPFLADDDKGFSSDGRLEHWVVIFKAPPEAADEALVFCVKAGSGATLLQEHLMAFSGLPSFDLEGWVDSTEIPFRNPPVDLELRTNVDLASVDVELAGYPVLWLAYTSFGRYDVYDAATGQYLKSR